MKALIVYKSIHLGNTKRIAEVMAKRLSADLTEPEAFDLNKIVDYDLIGFGSGIYSDKHHQSLLDLVDRLPDLKEKRVFVFSTAAIVIPKSHKTIKQKLQEKKAIIVDEFACRGLNKNSFMKYLGGMNKGRPNEDDFTKAEDFANRIK